MSFFQLYADESGKLSNLKCEYVSFCGYIATASELTRFEMEWENCRIKWQVPPIHMGKIMHPDGSKRWQMVKDSWGAEWKSRRDEMLEDFSVLINQSRLMAVGAVLDADHFRSMPDSEFKRGVSDPVVLTFQTMIMEAIDKTRVVSIEYPVYVMVDDEEKFAIRCHEWLNEFKAVNDIARRRVRALAFMDDELFPGIQAADMIAYEARALMVKRKATPDCLPTARYAQLTSNGLHQPKFMNAAFLELASKPVSST